VARILGSGAFLAAALLAGVASAPAPAAAAQLDLSYTSSSTWTADPVAGRVHVHAFVTVVSHTVDAGGRRFFYDNLLMTLPPATAGFEAAGMDGKPLEASVQSTARSGVALLVALGRRLYSGDTDAFELTFDLVDSGGSTDRDLRLRSNIVSFPVAAFGSPGARGSNVTVLFPAGFTVQEEYGDLTRSPGTGQTVFVSGVLDDAGTLSAWFTAVRPVPQTDFSVRYARIGSLRVTLRYWSYDPGWADQVQRVLESGYPVLREAIGLGDPTGSVLTVEEASTQEIGGFSGLYDPATGQVSVSYLADPFVVLHEAAHMWFNDDLSTDRWIDEGFASYYAQQALRSLGMVDHSPVLTDRLTQAALPFNDWASAGQPGSAADGYLYAATLEVARQIGLEAGPGVLRTVWTDARSGTAAYQPLTGPRTETVVKGDLDWRRLLDLLEQKTGRSFQAIWRNWVISPGQSSLLRQRSSALTSYADAQGAAGSWNLPPEVRRSLDLWQFDTTTALVGQVHNILDQRDQVARLSSQEGTKPPATLRAAFETSIGAASNEAANETGVLGELLAARQARANSEGATRALGLLGADPEADLAAARASFATGDLGRAMTLASQARQAWEGAATSGQIRLIGALLALAGLILLLFAMSLVRPSRRNMPVPVAAEGEIAVASASEPEAEPEPGRESPEAATGPDDEESGYDLLQRGKALMEDRHMAQAAIVLERASRVEPRKGSILELLGRAYFNSGQHARAAETFETLLELDPSAHYGHFALGLSFARMGRSTEALKHFRIAAALDPANETYRKALDKAEAAKA